MAIFLFIRHGMNDFTGKRLVGRLPGVHLNEEGNEQAEAVADFLHQETFAAIYSSPLERAAETAAPLAARKGLLVEYSESLSEVDFGKIQGKTNQQLKRMTIWETVHSRPSIAVFPGGESLVQAQTRVIDFIEHTNKKFEEKDLIACFTHSDVVRLMLAHYLCMNLDDFHRLTVDTASISTLQYFSDNIRVLNINQKACSNSAKLK